MMNAGNLKGKTRQTSDWRRRMIAFVSALTLLISSCGLTAFAESDEDIYSDPVTAPIPAANTSPEPEEGEAQATPAPEGQPEEGTEPQEATGEGTETEGEPEVSEEPEDLTVYEPGTLTAEADGVGITVDYTAEARVPEGTVLTLTRAAGGDLYSALKSASKVLKTEENATWKRELGEDAVFYAITLTNPEGNEVHPETGVTLTCTNLEIPADATGFVTGDNAENLDWKDTLTVGFLPEAIGYAYLKQVQIGTVTLTHEDRDYRVTAAYSPDAGFPADTELKVREIKPGTPEYALYSGMTEDAVSEDWSEITLQRYFDITFTANGEELEPKADVDVQIVFRDKIEQNEETEVAAVHIENNEANVIEAETDSTKSARHDDEAIDTVTFTSDSFSVYGVVQKKKIITKVLAADGNTYEIEISYTQEAEIPEESQVKVEEIPEGSDLWEAYRKQTAAALNADDVRLPGLYDISIIDAEGNKVEPKAPVNVAIKLANAENTDEELHVIHFTEEIPQELVAAAQPEAETIVSDDSQAEKQTEVQSEPLAEEDMIASETINASVEGDTVTFDTQGFSVYAFAYTVDFHFVVDGQRYDFSIPGGGYITLTDLVELLHVPTFRGGSDAEMPEDEEAGHTELPVYIIPDVPISEATYAFVENVESVTFSSPELASVSKVEQKATVGEIREMLGLETEYSTDLTDAQIEKINAQTVNSGDWVLISTKAFNTEESLYVTLKTGESFTIRITDAQIKKIVMTASGEAYEITVTYGEEAQIPDGSELVVREILPETGEFNAYYEEAAQAAIADVENRGTAIVPIVTGTRLFDIEIHNQEGKIEPAAPVQVSIRLLDTDGDLLSVVHFADEGTETMKLKENVETVDESVSEIRFETASFSVYSVVSFQDAVRNGGSYVLVSGIAGDPGANVGYSETWGTDYFTRIVNGNAVMGEQTDPDKVDGRRGLKSTGVHVWSEGSGTFVGGIATEWEFESAGNNRYYIKVKNSNKYIVQLWTDNQPTERLGLTENTEWRTGFEIVHNNDGTVSFRGADDWYLSNIIAGYSNEWSTRVFMMSHSGDNTNRNFRLAKLDSQYEAVAAEKIGASQLTAGNLDFLIYRSIINEDGTEELYALADDGSLVRIYDGGDTVYWRKTDKNIYWNYQLGANGHYIFSKRNPSIFISPQASANQVLSNTQTGLTLIGKDNDEYKTTIENWDQASYDYAGLHIGNNGGNATLTAGKRNEGTSDEFFFACAAVYPGDEAILVDTVDSSALGIKITMFDYGDATHEYNAGEHLDDMTAIAGSDAYTPHAAHALVTPYLSSLYDGVPVSSSAGAMNGLFRNGGSAVKRTITGVNKLFLASYYNASGTFRYRSEDNYAYLDGSNFKVYRQVATPYTDYVSVGHSYYYHGHFMPFNDIDMNNNLSRLMAQSGTDPLDTGDSRAYEAIYGIQGIPNYYTGMKMEGNFVQPRGGKLENGNDMIFRFTGDDDMWVYIDGVLVLDIGGIHEPLTGVIDFATGKVTNPTGSSLVGTKTLYQIFMAVRDNAPEEIRNKIDSIIWKDVNGDGVYDTFADHSNHSFSAFYMERGAGASNLDLQFNLSVLQKDEFVVKKELTEGIDPRYVNQTYRFQATYKDASGNEQPLHVGVGSCTEVVYQDQKDENGREIPVNVDNDGYFTLKPGEAAVFRMNVDSTEYNVREVSIDTDFIESVQINGQTVQLVNQTAEAGFARVYDRNQVLYINNPYTQNLMLTKHLYYQADSEHPVFEFRVYMESVVNEEGTETRKLVPCSYAPYYLVKVSEDDDQVHFYKLTGTNNAPVDQGTTPVICSSTGRSGSINSIPPEYTVVIPSVTVGTNFYIVEYNIPSGYFYANKRLANADDADESIKGVLEPAPDNKKVTDSEIYGKIRKNADAHAHIYNKKKTELTVEKNWNKGDISIPDDAYVEVTLGRYKLQREAGYDDVDIDIDFTADPGNGSNSGTNPDPNPDPGPEVEKWTVSFNSNGGSGTMHSVKVIKGQKYMLPPCVFTAPNGQGFDGWDLGAAGTEIDITADTEITAQWTTVPFSVNVAVSNMPENKSMWIWLQDVSDEFKTADQITVSANGTYSLTAPRSDHRYQLCFGKNGDWGSYDLPSEYLVSGETYYNLYDTDDNGRYLVNGGTYSIACKSPESNETTLNFEIRNTWNNPKQAFVTGTYTDVPVGSEFTFSFETDGWWDRMNGKEGSAEYAGEAIAWKSDNLNNGKYKYTISFTVKRNATLVVGVNADNQGVIIVDSINPANYSTSSTSGSLRKENKFNLFDLFVSSADADEAASASLQGLSDEQIRQLLGTPTDGEWVKDNWSGTERIVTLNNDNEWSDIVRNLPVTDDDGSLYVYYIESVLEFNLPDGEWQPALDQDHLLVRGDYLNAGDDDSNGTLSLTNTIKGHISVKKEDVWDDTADESIQVDNTFTFFVKQGEDLVDTLTVQQGTTDTTVDLELGKTYTIEEDEGDSRKIPGYTFKSVSITVDGQPYDSSTGITLNDNTTVVVRAVNHYTPNYIPVLIPASVSFKKVDRKNGRELEGATFKLYSNNPDVDNEQQPIATFTTTPFTISTNDTYIPAFPQGANSITLYLKETEAPQHHQLIDHTYEITISRTIDDPTLDPVKDAFVTTTTYSITVDGETATYQTVNDEQVLVPFEIENPVETTNIDVEKSWGEGQEPPEGSVIVVKLTATAGGNSISDADLMTLTNLPSLEVTLNGGKEGGTDTAEKPWQYRWEDLPKYNSAGKLIAYSATETSYKIGEIEYIETLNGTVTVDGYSIAVTNTVPTTNVDVEKSWGEGQEPPEGSVIVVKLTATAGGNSISDADLMTLTNLPSLEVTLNGGKEGGTDTAEKPWQYRWEDLPKYNSAGKLIAYSATETSYKIGEIEYIETLNGTVTVDGYSIGVTNTVPKTERHAVKAWVDRDNVKDVRPKSITFTLIATADNQPVNLSAYRFTGAIEQTVGADDNNIMHADWTELPVFTSDGKQIIYDVVETEPILYIQTGKEYAEDTFTFTFTNTLINLKIIKVDSENKTKKLSGAVFELRKKDGSNYVAVTDGSVGNVGSNGQFTVNEEIFLIGLTDGDYQIVEISPPIGYLYLNTVFEFTVKNGAISEPQVDGKVIEYTAATANDDAEFQVANTPGTELPSTGGSGTLIYTVAGIFLITLAGVLLVSRKRKFNR